MLAVLSKEWGSVMHYIEGNDRCYICGIPGAYAVKSTGNNRIIARDLPTLEDARTRAAQA